MLLSCPECELQVSDRALMCPHCGYPLSSQVKRRKNNKRHKRLPNGFGRITEIKGYNLRKPFRVMVTVGKDEYGNPISRMLKPEAYFETYNDAYTALVEYNKSPFQIDGSITVTELYDKWTEEYFKTLTKDSSRRTIEMAWKKCGLIYAMRVSDLRAYHIKGLMNDDKLSDNTKARIKSLFNLMLDYALEHEIVTVNVARTFKLTNSGINIDESTVSHIPFTDDEMDLLWANRDMDYVNIVLAQCYSGWRPQEICLIMLNDVDLDNWVFIGGMKTDAGKNRTVPIHSKIREIIKEEYDRSVKLGSNYLFSCYDSKTHSSNKFKMTYDKYNYRFCKIRDTLSLNPDHRPHDPRKHFVTMAKKYNVDEYAIKYIVGHTINDITEKVYTERDGNWLKEEIEKIK